MSSLLRGFANFLEVIGMVDEQKIAEKVEEVWGGLESIASEISEDLKRSLQRAEVLFKFAKSILHNRENITDSYFSFRFYGSEVAVEATFNGVHLHTIFVSPDTQISKIREEFIDPKVVLKSALQLLIWALREASYAINDWVNKHC
jgi:hypothetical protein